MTDREHVITALTKAKQEVEELGFGYVKMTPGGAEKVIELLQDGNELQRIADKYGLTREGVDHALRQYEEILSWVTRGRLSKLTYEAADVIRLVSDIEFEEIDEAIEDAKADWRNENGY